MQRFSANLGFLWPDLPLLERVDAAARAGFRAVELHWPYDVPAAVLRERLRIHDLQLLSINTVRGDAARGENGLGALAGREAEFQAAVRQSVAYAVEAGATAIHCMAGRVEPALREHATAVMTTNMREAADEAATHGLTLLLEPLNPKDAPGYFYSTLDEAAAVLAAVDRANVRLMFDAYHVGMVGEDIVQSLRRHWPSVGHVQIAAVPSRAEPDEGSFDYRLLFAALDELGYSGWIGAEYKPRAGTDEGLGWLARFGTTA